MEKVRAGDGKRGRRAVGILGGIAAAAALVVVHLSLRDYAFDDAYIHFRIARTFVETGRPELNPGEAVPASSSPGWTLLLSGGLGAARAAGAAPDLPSAVAVVNALATLAGAATWVRILRRVAVRPSRAVPGLFALAYVATVLPASLGLMEVPVALLVVGLGLRRLAEGEPRAFAWLAAAVFFRPELLLVLALAGLVRVEQGGRVLARAAAWAGGGAAPFVLFGLVFFGAVVPQAVRAKSVVYDVAPAWVATTAAASLVPTVELGAFVFDPDPRFALATIASLVAVAGVTFLRRRRTARERAVDVADDVSLVVLAWGPGLVALYCAAGAFLFPWYVPLYGVPVLFAAAEASMRARRASTRFAILLLALPLLTKFGWIPQTALAAWKSPAFAVGFVEGARARHYVALGRELFERYPDQTLLTSEIGGLGYGFRGRIADAAGLATPRALAFHPMRVPDERRSGLVGAIPPAFVAEVQPGLIVTYDGFAEALLRGPEARAYRRIRRPLFLADDRDRGAPERFWGSRHLNVLVRKDLPLRLEGRNGMIHPDRDDAEARTPPRE